MAAGHEGEGEREGCGFTLHHGCTTIGGGDGMTGFSSDGCACDCGTCDSVRRGRGRGRGRVDAIKGTRRGTTPKNGTGTSSENGTGTRNTPSDGTETCRCCTQDANWRSNAANRAKSTTPHRGAGASSEAGWTTYSCCSWM